MLFFFYSFTVIFKRVTEFGRSLYYTHLLKVEKITSVTTEPKLFRISIAPTLRIAFVEIKHNLLFTIRSFNFLRRSYLMPVDGYSSLRPINKARKQGFTKNHFQTFDRGSKGICHLLPQFLS